ncbi:phosphoglycerate kinase [Patescibacteria group bacterium]|nr:phosphoglycerate kinase [Patescibacteria group bacterium]
MKRIKDLSLQGKRVLIRCDLNVPLDEKGEIADDFRIRSVLPTLRHALSYGARVILISHLGKPGGKRVARLSLKKVAERLEKLHGAPVKFVRDCVGLETEAVVENLKGGELLVLENLRFHKGETENSASFGKALAFSGDVYVNDAFAAAHRQHASIVQLPHRLPSAAGLLMEKEIANLTRVRDNPERPFVVLAGGAKVKDKSSFIAKMSAEADWVLLGNLLSQGLKESGLKVPHPERLVFAADGRPSAGSPLDIGPETVRQFKEKIRKARTVLWAGPLGKVEEDAYEKGSLEVARAVLKSEAFFVVGGGDLVGFLNRKGLAGKVGHVSTGGGAMLAFISGEQLVGLKALE